MKLSITTEQHSGSWNSGDNGLLHTVYAAVTCAFSDPALGPCCLSPVIRACDSGLFSDPVIFKWLVFALYFNYSVIGLNDLLQGSLPAYGCSFCCKQPDNCLCCKLICSFNKYLLGSMHVLCLALHSKLGMNPLLKYIPLSS